MERVGNEREEKQRSREREWVKGKGGGMNIDPAYSKRVVIKEQSFKIFCIVRISTGFFL